MPETDNISCTNLGELFADTAIRHAARPALIWDDAIVTYQELAAQVESLAASLHAQGCRQGNVVAITGSKRTTTYALLLACLRLGASYVMLDPLAPLTRQEKILQKCQPTIIFVDSPCISGLIGIAHSLNAKVIDINSFDSSQSIADAKKLINPSRFSSQQPAYIMFTSGSTGFPKGAIMTHLNVMLLISWAREEFGFGPGEILTNVNPLYFDNSVFDIYASLFTGAALAPFNEQVTRSPGDLLKGIDRRGCTSWFSVPSLLMYLDSMKALRTNTMTGIRRFIFGGEGYPKARLKKLFDIYSHRAELINVYGPTECTCICSSYRLTSKDFDDPAGFPPLGAMTGNFDFLILDNNNQKTAIGEAGELCLLGPCVGKGYYNDPERTSAAFVANPLKASTEELMYRTGDIVKLDPKNRKIHIAGRKDHQVKHMGYRIELEEIENALVTIAGIQRAVAVHGEKRGISTIIAVISTSQKYTESEIKEHLRRILPNYMIPAEIHSRDILPLSQNGKIDRKRISAEFFPGNGFSRH